MDVEMMQRMMNEFLQEQKRNWSKEVDFMDKLDGLEQEDNEGKIRRVKPFFQDWYTKKLDNDAEQQRIQSKSYNLLFLCVYI